MRRQLAFAFILVLIALALCACGEKVQNSSNVPNVPSTVTTASSQSQQENESLGDIEALPDNGENASITPGSNPIDKDGDGYTDDYF